MVMRKVVKIFKALSDSNRIRILKMLEGKPMCVCDIKDVLGLANSTVSKHLSLLRDAEFISDEKNGKWVYYSLNKMNYEKYINQILPLMKEWLNYDGTIQSDRIKAVNCNNNICNI